jgi:hypothetical protein
MQGRECHAGQGRGVHRHPLCPQPAQEAQGASQRPVENPDRDAEPRSEHRHALATGSARAVWSESAFGLLFTREGQQHDKGRAYPLYTLNFDPPAVALHQVLDDG